MQKKYNKSIIVFDGYCNLCSKSVVFILKKEKNDRFLFTSGQSSFTKSLSSIEWDSSKIPESIVLIENENMYTRSTAALRIARKLKWPWPLLYTFIIVPPFIRNWVYNLIAQNRYRWFGQRQSCFMPEHDVSHKFLS